VASIQPGPIIGFGSTTRFEALLSLALGVEIAALLARPHALPGSPRLIYLFHFALAASKQIR